MFVVERNYLKHVGGTKSYSIISILNSKTKAFVVINRWGKINQFGQMKVICGNGDPKHNCLEKRAEKALRGYKLEEAFEGFADSIDMLKKTIGLQYWYNLGINNIRHIVPDIAADELKRVRDPSVCVVQPNDESWEEKDKQLKEAIVPEIKVETIEEKIAKNVNWGMF